MLFYLLIFCIAALVYEESIRSTSGVANIRKNMGVCPQVRNPFVHSLFEYASHLVFFMSVVLFGLITEIRI